MLTTSQKNFKTLKHCPSLVRGQLPDCTGTVRSAQRENIDLPGSRCFLLHGLLTPEECAFYVEETERVGYSTLSDLFKSEYRSNDRLLSISEELADGLYERLESHLERRDIIRVRPVGFGNENYFRARTLYVKSHENEQAGDIQGCTDTYLEALQLQLQVQQSIGSDTKSLALWPVPFEILLHIFSYLNAKDLTVCMQVCKDWYDVAIDGELWYNLYINRWPACKKVEQTFRHRYCEVSGSFTRDWYGCYKQRTMSVKSFRAVVLDLGSHTVKCGIMTSRGQEPIILKRESVVAKVKEQSKWLHDYSVRVGLGARDVRPTYERQTL
jgi:hypothetical protein